MYVSGPIVIQCWVVNGLLFFFFKSLVNILNVDKNHIADGLLHASRHCIDATSCDGSVKSTTTAWCYYYREMIIKTNR